MAAKSKSLFEVTPMTKPIKRVIHVAKKKVPTPHDRLDDFYDPFIRGLLNVGFTDDQVDLLWFWFEEFYSLPTRGVKRGSKVKKLK